MKRLLIGSAVAIVLLGGAVYALRSSSDRADCPGKIVCPLTGEVICADRCPLGTAAAAETARCRKQTKP